MTALLAYDSSVKTNSELIARCAKLGFINEGMVSLDATFGLGNFWNDWQPDVLFGADLDPVKARDLQASFTCLPFKGDTFDLVVFDPPYKMCVDDQTQILTRSGWKTCDQVLVGEQAWSLNPETGLAGWETITDLNIYAAEPTEVEVCAGKNINFVATPNHQWFTKGYKDKMFRHVGASRIPQGQRIVKAARKADVPTSPTWSDAWVELVAWYWTEGTLNKPSFYGHITQSHAVNEAHCGRIARCFESEFGRRSVKCERTGRTSVAAWRVKDELRNRRFIFSATIGRMFEECAPGRVPTTEFLESLTAHQLELFIDVSMSADGYAESQRLTQKNPSAAEAFALACLFAGRSVSIRSFPNCPNNGTVVTIVSAGAKPHRPGIRKETRFTRVWCPTVKATGTWMARREGCVYFTGNSGVERVYAGPDDRYGVRETVNPKTRMQLIVDGAVECARVTRLGGKLLVKCQDQVVSGKVVWQTHLVANALTGCRLVDEVHLLGGMPQPSGRTQRHFRHNASTLQIYEKEKP